VAVEFYHLPATKIAQTPPRARGESKLLVLDRSAKTIQDKAYADVVDYLRAGDVLVLNDTKVMPARLLTRLADGRQRELLLVEAHADGLPTIRARVLHRGKLCVGDTLSIGDDYLRVIEVCAGGQAVIESTRSIAQIAEVHGKTPLPPYIRRVATNRDKQRYQTVFARQDGSVAAPTASLNMTDEIMDAIRAKGVEIVWLTLHVGRGTFLPIRENDIAKHKMHQEYFEIPAATIRAIKQAKARGGRVVAVGTTVTRALEYAAGELDRQTQKPIIGEADIFIHPGYDFRVVDALLTNFHAPESTVLQLAAAFAGEDLLKLAYDHALETDYRFLSYGDSMLII
jgi:S-adenosylmethionine:tRNA ribosyltransferase-isomerase